MKGLEDGTQNSIFYKIDDFYIKKAIEYRLVTFECIVHLTTVVFIHIEHLYISSFHFACIT